MAKKPASQHKELSVSEKLDVVGIDAICERVANCDFLQSIADDCGVSRGSLTKWLNSDANSVMYAHARESQADKMAEDILKIADDGINDKIIGEDGVGRTDQDVIARSRLRVDARKWLASKMAPKKYGDRQAIDVTDHTPKTPEQVNTRIAELLALAQAKSSEQS